MSRESDPYIEELERRVTEYRTILDSTPVMFWYKDTENRLLQVNRAAAEFEGVEQSAVVDKSCWDLYPKDQADAFFEDDLEVIRSGKPKLDFIEAHTAVGTGNLMWVSVGKVPTRDASGRINGVIAFAVDITKRKHAEDALRASEESLATTLQSIGDAVIATDSEGCVERMNRVGQELTGWAIDDAIGRPLEDVLTIVDAETREPFETPTRMVLEHGEILELGRNALLISRDGTERRIADSVAPITDDTGKAKGVVLVFRDVTENLQLEEQLRQAQKLESVGRLAGGIAHDFNNLLGGIIGYAELISTLPQSNSTSRGYVDRILEAGQRASELTSQLLAFSRKGEAATQAVDLHEAVRSVVGIVSRTVDPRIEIALELRSAAPVIQGDASQLQSALLNLAVNACDAMPDGGKLIISTRDSRLSEETTFSHSQLPPGCYVELAVIDTGVGMPPEVLAHLFEPFFTTKEVGKGTGLGLATVYGTARAHHGGIDVSSRASGSEIRLFLPATGESEVGPSLDAEGAEPGAGRILLVDDEELIRDSGRTMLRRLGYKVLLAADGNEAVEIYSRLGSSIDLVILDIVMPNLNGADAFRKLKALNPQIRVIMASGFGFETNANELIEEGVAVFLQKPYNLAQLSQAVTSALERERRASRLEKTEQG